MALAQEVGLERTGDDPILEVRDLCQEFTVGSGSRRGKRARRFEAVSHVSLVLGREETLGIVGETGCGKSSLAKAIVHEPRPTSGAVILKGRDLTKLSREDLRTARKDIQLAFQDPYSALNPRWPALRLIEEPLRIHGTVSGKTRRARAEELLELVGLDPSLYGGRRSGELSGGECQRVSIARALALSPTVLVLDEPVSALDVSIQAQVLNVLGDIRGKLGLSYLFISHDLGVIRHMSDRVMVMYLGKVAEIADSTQIYRRAAHPYTAELLAAVPKPNVPVSAAARETKEDVASALAPPSGCRFRTRCPFATDRCASEVPELKEITAGHWAACHYPLSRQRD